MLLMPARLPFVECTGTADPSVVEGAEVSLFEAGRMSVSPHGCVDGSGEACLIERRLLFEALLEFE